MLVLGFDTATADGGVALFSDEKVIAELKWRRERSHGEVLTVKIEEIMRGAGLRLRDLDRLAIGNGPGSFTGVRVAVNAARSLGFALARPIHVFDTSEIIAAGCERTDHPLAVVINAHKNMVFSTTFRFEAGRWRREQELTAKDPEVFGASLTETHLCLGDGFDEYRDHFSTYPLLRDPTISDAPAAAALSKLVKFGQPLEWNAVQALYIRDSGAEEKLRENSQG